MQITFATLYEAQITNKSVFVSIEERLRDRGNKQSQKCPRNDRSPHKTQEIKETNDSHQSQTQSKQRAAHKKQNHEIIKMWTMRILKVAIGIFQLSIYYRTQCSNNAPK